MQSDDESTKLQSDTASGTALTPVRRQTVVDLDGFKDFTNEAEGAGDDGRVNTSARVIQGTKLKFNDPRWLIDGRDVTGICLTVIGVRNVVTKWGGEQQTADHQYLAAGNKVSRLQEAQRRGAAERVAHGLRSAAGAVGGAALFVSNRRQL